MIKSWLNQAKNNNNNKRYKTTVNSLTRGSLQINVLIIPIHILNFYKK